MISESYKNRIKKLSGIRLNEVELNATSGRSGKNTFGYFVEEYLLNVGEIFFNDLKKKINENQNKNLEIKNSNNKIQNNSVLINFQIEDTTDRNNIEELDFSITFLVKIESNSNTVALLKYENVNDEFNLQSKHSENDLQDFINEITLRVINVEKTN
jgi:hypothetical protein